MLRAQVKSCQLSNAESRSPVHVVQLRPSDLRPAMSTRTSLGGLAARFGNRKRDRGTVLLGCPSAANGAKGVAISFGVRTDIHVEECVALMFFVDALADAGAAQIAVHGPTRSGAVR